MPELAQKPFDDWVAYRQSIGDPLTELSKKKFATRLSRYEPIMQVLLVKQAIQNGWLSPWRDFKINEQVSTDLKNPLEKPKKKGPKSDFVSFN